ncbi:hypothetical protein BJ508DRAFT_381226 [Ascobolus immersus RN42]|uniref:Uncharacterized protein n=1 Tax=Ascobolus immersus RN42 TaxID=1160509 RepID=A0A3N4HIB7_ASCIM|nr:hypothetical protein BJ508DRAFT_381226 [Ascobolus immersus RN42]
MSASTNTASGSGSGSRPTTFTKSPKRNPFLDPIITPEINPGPHTSVLGSPPILPIPICGRESMDPAENIIALKRIYFQSTIIDRWNFTLLFTTLQKSEDQQRFEGDHEFRRIRTITCSFTLPKAIDEEKKDHRVFVYIFRCSPWNGPHSEVLVHEFDIGYTYSGLIAQSETFAKEAKDRAIATLRTTSNPERFKQQALKDAEKANHPFTCYIDLPKPLHAGSSMNLTGPRADFFRGQTCRFCNLERESSANIRAKNFYTELRVQSSPLWHLLPPSHFGGTWEDYSSNWGRPEETGKWIWAFETPEKRKALPEVDVMKEALWVLEKERERLEREVGEKVKREEERRERERKEMEAKKKANREVVRWLRWEVYVLVGLVAGYIVSAEGAGM